MKTFTGYALRHWRCTLGSATAAGAIIRHDVAAQITHHHERVCEAGQNRNHTRQNRNRLRSGNGRSKWPERTSWNELNFGQVPVASFFTGYESFDAWEKDVAATQKNAMLSAGLDRAGVADGELLDSMDAGVFVYNAEFSLNQQAEHATAGTRYFEVSVYHVKRGHRKEWSEGVRMVLEGYKKAAPEAHWACYESLYGAPEGTYLFIVARKSAGELDSDFVHNKDFMEALGEEGMKKLEELSAASINPARPTCSR